MTDRSSRPYDVIIYGASGYTGRLAAEHMNDVHGADGPVKWAMAGRNLDKLKEVAKEIGVPDSVPLIEANSDDPASLDAMTSQTRAIVTTAGPYQLYGEPVIASCAKNGTDYTDLCGESNWIHDMIHAHHETAQKTGARLVFSCGFDSIPFDMGVYFVEEAAKKKFGKTLPRVRGRVRGMRGGMSGGTMASGQATAEAAQKDPNVFKILVNPFALTPGYQGVDQPVGHVAVYDDVIESWCAPFMMAAINTKAVHRSNFLLGNEWGTDFQYDEMLMTEGEPKKGPDGGFDQGFDASQMLQPGEGPTPEERQAGFYDCIFVATGVDGERIQAAVKGDLDPGYGSTSKMLAESAICLAQDISHDQTPGGCWTTAAGMGDTLINRLEKYAGLTFEVEG